LSTLTKVLIILLTTFSLFLCAMVVTYVAHAENQKARADKLQARVNSAERLQQAAEADLVAAKKETQDKEAKFNADVGDLKAEITKLTAQVMELDRQRTKAEQDRDEQIARADIATKVSESQTQLYKEAQTKLAGLEAEKTQRDKELAELNMELMAKLTLLAQRDEEKRQLAEANQDLSNRLNQYLQKYGVMAIPPKVATATTGMALPAASLPVRDLDLSGKIVGVDLQGNLAEVSLGTAQGVRTNMTFHVRRGEQFICDIVIDRVDTDKAVGSLKVFDRNRAEPQVGDVVSTNL
jgi:hypothetical protein